MATDAWNLHLPTDDPNADWQVIYVHADNPPFKYDIYNPFRSWLERANSRMAARLRETLNSYTWVYLNEERSGADPRVFELLVTDEPKLIPEVYKAFVETFPADGRILEMFCRWFERRYSDWEREVMLTDVRYERQREEDPRYVIEGRRVAQGSNRRDGQGGRRVFLDSLGAGGTTISISGFPRAERSASGQKVG